MAEQVSAQILHDLTMLYLQKHPERLGPTAPPENYLAIYMDIANRIKAPHFNP